MIGAALSRPFVALLFSLAIAVASSLGAQVLNPPEAADKAQPQITATSDFDSATGIYTYTYVVGNKKGAKQNIETITLETGAPVLNATSPPGWRFYTTNSGEQAYLTWSATATSMDANGIPEEPPATIKKAETLTGFSFQSAAPPGTVTFYVEGWVPMPAGESEDDFADFDPALFDFTQNSDSGAISGPVAPCGDGVDNDGDGAADFPNDPGCRDLLWPVEDPACNNGTDDDSDSAVDFPDDPGCHHAYDLSEVADCADGIDNTLDGLIDFPQETGCFSLADVSEEPNCADAIDNDQDGLTDSADFSCGGRNWPIEATACDDGVDNDGDGLADLNDPECGAEFDNSETADCADGQDNDFDGQTDLDDPECLDAQDLTEQPECSDLLDNDGDGLVDAGDPQCGIDPGDPSVSEVCGGDSDGSGIGDFCECGDGICNAVEDSCSCEVDCGPPAALEQDDLACSDGLDNDCDGEVDCEDPGCSSLPSCVCDNDGTCEAGEDCASCAADCPSGSLATCGNGVCDAADGEDCLSCAPDCNGKQKGKESSRFCCGAGGGQNPVTCSDARCTSRKVSCTGSPAGSFCCGDGLCQGAEAMLMCAIDCGP